MCIENINQQNQLARGALVDNRRQNTNQSPVLTEQIKSKLCALPG